MGVSGWDAVAVAAKVLVYAATLGASGAVFFLSYARSLLTGAQRATIRRIVAIEIGLAASFTVLRIPLLAGAMSGNLAGMFDRDLAGLLWEAGEGTATALRLVGLALVGLALAGCAWSPHRRLQIPGLVGAVIAATSFSGVGHGRALQPHLPATLLSCLHLIGVAFWLGALLPLLWSTREPVLELGAVARRFGKLGVAAVSTLVIAGLCQLWMLSDGHAEFWRSGYGILIAVKLLLVALLLGVAAINKLWLTPRLMNGEVGAVLLMRRSIQVELLMAVLILIVTASFTSLTGPPR